MAMNKPPAPPLPPTQGEEEIRKLLKHAFVVSAQDEGGSYLGDMSAKVALAEMEAALSQRADEAARAERERCAEIARTSHSEMNGVQIASAIRARITP